ncbi:hypothetical protein [Paenibacillus gansuensis]|uniref:Uncharacterized protein n=1 Tax=Paenibacillus gansuensis TaxID=306542 RepID=A0ABW5PE17_9BACL
MVAALKLHVKKYGLLIIAGLIIVGGFAKGTIILQDITERDYLAMNSEERRTLKEGTYSLFYEYNESNRRFGPVTITENNKISDVKSALEFKIVAPADLPQPVIADDTSLSYTVDESKGESLYSFHIHEEGSYILHTKINETLQENGLSLTLLYNYKGLFLTLIKVIGISILISLPFVLGGLWIYHRDEKRRINAKRV